MKDPISRSAWNVIVGSVAPGVLAAADQPLLVGACRWYALWAENDKALSEGTAADPYKTMIQAAIAWKAFTSALTKLSISPADRSKLHVPLVEPPANPKSRFFQRKVC
jgi:hypothetical protein